MSHVFNGHNNCPICHIEKNSLLSKNPELSLQYSKKNPITPDKVFHKSQQVVIWQCLENVEHEWKSTPETRSKSQSVLCPYCESEKNLLVNERPDLAKQYSSKNKIPLNVVKLKSNEKFIWNCDNGHEWESSPSSRSRSKKSECSICIKESNYLYKKIPELKKYYSNENTIKFEELTIGSELMLKWNCENNHSWEQTPYKMSRLTSFCVLCKKEENSLVNKAPHLEEEYDPNNDVLFSDLTIGSKKKVKWICRNNSSHTWLASVKDRYSGTGCPKCDSIGVSKSETEVFEYVKTLLPKEINIERNDRTLLNSKELDIYIPDKNIAIEFNGIYWHSEKNKKDKNYHYNKWLECKQKGVQLITIWEDDWDNRKDIVKTMLAHKLHVSNQDKIYARKTFIKEVDYMQASSFCENTHIQGVSSGTYYISLNLNSMDTDEIVAMSVWRKQKDILYLDRYSTSCHVVGGLGKMLKYVNDKIVNYNNEVDDNKKIVKNCYFC